MKILVTSGATREPIDKVRFITNLSTGRTGSILADIFTRLGHEVTYLHGENSVQPQSNVKSLTFSTFQDLDGKLKDLLSDNDFDAIFHLAAVSDYSIEQVLHGGKPIQPDAGKISSGGTLEIKFKQNHKILNHLKDYSRKNNILVFGFKLTHSENTDENKMAVERLFSEGNVDFVVHNDLKEIHDLKTHRFHIYDSSRRISTCANPTDLATQLNTLLEAP